MSLKLEIWGEVGDGSRATYLYDNGDIPIGVKRDGRPSWQGPQRGLG